MELILYPVISLFSLSTGNTSQITMIPHCTVHDHLGGMDGGPLLLSTSANARRNENNPSCDGFASGKFILEHSLPNN